MEDKNRKNREYHESCEARGTEQQGQWRRIHNDETNLKETAQGGKSFEAESIDVRAREKQPTGQPTPSHEEQAFKNKESQEKQFQQPQTHQPQTHQPQTHQPQTQTHQPQTHRPFHQPPFREHPQFQEKQFHHQPQSQEKQEKESIKQSQERPKESIKQSQEREQTQPQAKKIEFQEEEEYIRAPQDKHAHGLQSSEKQSHEIHSIEKPTHEKLSQQKPLHEKLPEEKRHEKMSEETHEKGFQQRPLPEQKPHEKLSQAKPSFDNLSEQKKPLHEKLSEEKPLEEKPLEKRQPGIIMTEIRQIQKGQNLGNQAQIPGAQLLQGLDTKALESTSNNWVQPLPDAKGTVRGKANYDRELAKEDAMNLLKAMKGAGTNKAIIVDISGSRTFAQRQMIVKEFETIDPKEKRDLLVDLKNEVGGDLEGLVLPLYMMPGEYDARLIEKALYGIKNDVDLLIEVLCTRTNKEIEDMKMAWKERIDSKQRLEERVGNETKKLLGMTNFHILCLKILEGKRPPCAKPDEKQVRIDAEELSHQLLESTDINSAKAKFVEIFTERSWAHIGALVAEFQNFSEKWTMESAIAHEFGDSSNTTKALRIIAEFCSQPYDFWAKRLREAMKGLGTNDSALIRIIVSRCETDLQNITFVFGQRYGDGKTLRSWIEDDTSGVYSKLLLNLCGYF